MNVMQGVGNFKILLPYRSCP